MPVEKRENMNLTSSLCCRRLSFTNESSCPHCGRTFPPGTLEAKAVAENKAFDRKSHILFIIAFLAFPAVLFFLQVQGYLHVTP
jgi:hypothetical protein